MPRLDPKNISDLQKLEIFHELLDAVNTNILKLKPSFKGYEMLITFTFSAKNGTLLPKIVFSSEMLSFVSFVEDQELVHVEPYISDPNEEATKEVGSIFPLIDPDIETVDEVIFVAGLMLFMLNEYADIDFLDGIFLDYRKVKDQTSLRVIQSLNAGFEQDEESLSRLSKWIKRFFPNNKKTLSLLNRLITEEINDSYDDEMEEQADEMEMDFAEEIFSSIKKKPKED